jgi:inner membrane protein
MTTTHMLLPLAATLAIGPRPVPWKLIIVASMVAGAPDIDGLFKHFLHVSPDSIYGHRGAAHSLFVALAAGLIAASLHRQLEVNPLTVAVVVSLAGGSHGALDMMTDSGQPVAYLWPLSSSRLFADWRPIHSSMVHIPHLSALSLSSFGAALALTIREGLIRFRSEFWQLILPMTAVAVAVRSLRTAINRCGHDDRGCVQKR